MPITITLQAASDAVMTENNVFDGTALADDDFRKVYGLSNQYVGNDNRIHIVKDVRWDTVTPPESAIKLDYTISTPDVDAWTMFYEEEINDVAWSLGKQRKPTTTAFQLRCDSISHDVQDMSSISPMPAFNNMEGTRFDTATPGQMNNLVIAFGMRTEVIKLSGVLVDEGPDIRRAALFVPAPEVLSQLLIIVPPTDQVPPAITPLICPVSSNKCV